jgi:hypothetical protein
MRKVGNRFKAIFGVFWELVWRGFGIFLFILGGSAGVGAAITGDWVNGILVAWGTLMLTLIAAIGYAIATTGRVTRLDVAKGANDAVQKTREQSIHKK